MSDQTFDTENVSVKGKTHLILPAARDGSQTENSVATKLAEKFAASDNVSISLNRDAFNKATRFGSAIETDYKQPVKLRIGILNSMLSRAATDVMLTQRIIESVEWAREHDRLNGDVAIEIVPISPRQLEHGLTEEAKDTDLAYVDNFHHTLDSASFDDLNLDTLVVTGTVPREDHLHKEVFWPDMKEAIDFIKDSKTPALFSCLAAQAYLQDVYDIPREKRDSKLFGHFKQNILTPHHPLLKDIPQDDGPDLYLPGSRFWQSNEDVLQQAVADNQRLKVITESADMGASIMTDRTEQRNVALWTLHPEYNKNTLANEYNRDAKLGLNPDKPENCDIDNAENNAVYFEYQLPLLFNALAPVLTAKAMQDRTAQDAANQNDAYTAHQTSAPIAAFASPSL